MKRKVLCVALALLMCMAVTLPTFADGSAETPQERALISATFGLKRNWGPVYLMWAKINNPEEVSVYVSLTLYDASYNQITSIYTISSDMLISLSKSLILSPGTYHLQLSYTAEGVTYSYEKTYNI